ncbi:hypothetical protein YPS_3093 [Yersinia pestis Pestoides A]|nr:hypothetical protein YPS_3093 [Yersinia pestis Pestoides A]
MLNFIDFYHQDLTFYQRFLYHHAFLLSHDVNH